MTAMTAMTPTKTLWSIKGGIHPAFNKAMSTQQASRQADLPKQLIIPLKQMSGRLDAFNLLVKVGDHVLKHQAIANCSVSTLHAPSSGKVSAIEERTVAHPSGLNDLCIVIDLDGKDEACKTCYPPITDYKNLTQDDLLERIQQAGITGLGGAVFPTRIKLGTTTKSSIHTLIINAAECEPYISCDDMLMQEKAAEIIQGIQIILDVTKVKQCLIGIEDNKPTAIKQLQTALAAHATEHRIHINVIPSVYPSGDEKQLTHILTGKSIPPGTRLPDYGFLVQNVATIYSIYEAVVQGKPLISRYVTVSGRGIKQPQNFQALIGTPFSHLIEQAGGYTEQAERLLMGGPMMGHQMQTDNIPVVKATNCILALPKEDLSYSTELAMPCIRCGKCVDACPVDLLPQQLYWHSRAKNHEQAEKHQLFSCIECGCCSYVCPSNIPLVQYYRNAKADIREEQAAKYKATQARERHEFREYRLQRDKEEKARKLAEHKKKVQSNVSGDDAKKAAIKAAMERAKAKKAQQNTQSPEQAKPDLTAASEEAQKARIKAAMERAKAKKAAKKAPLSEEEKQAKIKAAMAAKAAKQAEATEPSKDSAAEEEQKARIKAALARAKAKKAAKQAPLSEEEKQAKIKAAMAAKAAKQNDSD